MRNHPTMQLKDWFLSYVWQRGQKRQLWQMQLRVHAIHKKPYRLLLENTETSQPIIVELNYLYAYDTQAEVWEQKLIICINYYCYLYTLFFLAIYMFSKLFAICYFSLTSFILHVSLTMLTITVYCMLCLLKIWKLGYQALNRVGRKKKQTNTNVSISETLQLKSVHRIITELLADQNTSR